MAFLSDILFILKRRDGYNPQTDYTHSLSTGLSNSCSFIDTMLKNNDVLSNIEIVNDNNDIDRVVTLHKPRRVIIEALWVTPEKFKVLNKLHPDVIWVVRLHSEIPFLANEGIAIQWINQYLTYPNVYVAANSDVIFEELQHYVKSYRKGYNKKLVYLPNHYELKDITKYIKIIDKDWIDVSCFGAIRPLKNHMIQALAALKFANKIGKKLRFHINSERTEQKGDSILKNLISFFDGLKGQGHELVMHEWKTYEEFLILCRSMDIGMQCSFSETFNIVAADHINMGVPVVVTDEIPWACSLFTANATNSDDICKKLRRAYKWADYNVYFNKKNIKKYNEEAEEYWMKFLLH